MKKVLTVFILDDEEFSQTLLKDFLTNFVFKKEEKFTIIKSLSLEDAEKQLDNLKNKVHLFLLDGTLHPGAGFDLIPIIKKTNKNAHIIMCSGNSSLNYKGVMEYGAHSDIYKNNDLLKPSESQESYVRELRSWMGLPFR